MDDGGGEIDRCLETAVCLVAPHCYAFEFFQLAEEILDQVAPLVNVDVERLGAPLMLRDYDLRPAFFRSSMIRLESKALSAIKPPNSMSLIRGATPTVSKRWPGSRIPHQIAKCVGQREDFGGPAG